MAYGIPERAVMIALMALNRETRNADLKERYRLDLKKAAREKLNGEGLVQSRWLPGRGFAHELTDAGWAWVVAELDAPVPPSGGLGRRRAVRAAQRSEGRARRAGDGDPGAVRSE